MGTMKATWPACLLLLAFGGCTTEISPNDAGSSGGTSSGGAFASSGSSTGDGGTDGSGALGGEGPTDTGGIGGADASTGGTSTGGAGGAGAGRADCKRGVAYGHHSMADFAALSPAVSWWYNWAFVPDQALEDGGYLPLDVEYVPMIWGAGSDRSAASTDIPDDARVLLGFNEPNFGSQANLSAQDAADLWPELEQIADARGLDLVSPAVNFCGGDCQETDPFQYLDDFLAACQGCRVDALAIHIYVGCNAGGENHAEWLINHVETYKSRFSQPLWLTEFACDDATSEQEQIAFLQDAVEFLESDARIARYAWFSGRFDGIPYVDLLGADGQLTALGERYVALDQPASCQR